ncbi:MAG: hypothetical protein D6732_29150 [Methanobacteriota archaeon]|nr:MAG: hypothetical protein D6732_29150 [Euryarchaeota archaeon]
MHAVMVDVDLSQLWNVVGLPIIGITVPLLFLIRRLRQSDYYIDLQMKKKLFLRFIILFFSMLFILIFLTGGIAEFYYLEPGIFINSYELKFNLTTHWAIIFIWFPGTTFIALSLLIAITYSVHFTLPPVCTLQPTKTDKQVKGTTETATSSFGALMSASASLVSCCTPSLVAVISPVFSSILGSFIPQLLVFSMIMVNYSFFKIVLPRFPISNS